MKRTLLAFLAGATFVMVGCLSSTDDKTAQDPQAPDPQQQDPQQQQAKNDDPTAVKAIVEENTIGTSNGTDKGSSGYYLNQ